MLDFKRFTFATEIDAKIEFAINKRRVEIDLISRKKKIRGWVGWPFDYVILRVGLA